jgi:nitroreductase
MELTEAILSRRSVRKFSDYFVKDEELREIMEAGRKEQKDFVHLNVFGNPF